MLAHGFFSPVRRLRLLCLLVGMGSATAATVGSWPNPAAPPPSTCTDISTIPVQYTFTYGAAIQSGIFHDFNGLGNGCADCHTTTMGTVIPSGNLDLDPLDSPSPYVNLVNVPSDADATLIYVVPNYPERSLLFQKVNCDNPSTGSRMPLGGYGGGLSPEQQALIYDWIAAGAPAGTTDGIFRNAFDYRGFSQ